MEQINFCDNWQFKKNNESSSQIITLPHDASFTELRVADSPGGSAHGYFPGGYYEYEKTFFVPEEWRNKVVIFQFGGVYKNSIVNINGEYAGGCAYGYSEFSVSGTNLLNFGQDNLIKVTADNTKLPDSRWYTGAGIYRPVTLLIGNKHHIHRRGVKISTISINPAKILIETKHTSGTVTVEIIDGKNIIAKGEGECVELSISNPRLWSDDSPYLYKCRVKLIDNKEITDEVIETFGIRRITWNNKGLFINGKETFLRGGCLHSDNGILGACTYQKAEERRIKILKEAGFNAIRVSHNPACEFMLDACDKYGMYVIDETWDMWFSHKSQYDYAGSFEKNYMFDIESLVDKDFNHPSVIMYSIGNEVSEPATAKGAEMTKKLVASFHKLDQCRAVTAGINLFVISRAVKGNPIYKEGGGLNQEQNSNNKMNSTIFNMMTMMVGIGMNNAANSRKADEITKPCLDALDIAGYNYASGRYPLESKANPQRIVVGTETFPSDIVKNWAMVKKYPYLIGDFMWTAWDYLGEAGLGAWAYTDDAKTFNKPYPWLLSGHGVFDIVGEPNGEAFLIKTLWDISKNPIIAVRPVNHDTKPIKSVWRGTNSMASWSWRGCEGKQAIVEVYSNAHYVKLFLNGKIQGKKKSKNCIAKFKIKYTPGKLEAVAFDSSKHETGRDELNSANGNIRIQISPEEKNINQGDIIFIPISLTGENGITESNVDTKLNILVEGGELLGFGSANPRTEESYTTGVFTTYYGKAQAIVRAGKSDIVKITVYSNELESAISEILVKD